MRYRSPFYISKGFTLLELILVTAVIAILAGLFITSYPASQRRARDTIHQSDIKQYQAAMEVYAASHNNLYFTTTTQDLTDYCSNLGLSADSQCPDDDEFAYQIISTTTDYVLWARLEQLNDSGNREYFIACSNGVTGRSESQPDSEDCPL